MDLSYKNIWKITYPIFISMLLQQIVGITDVIFLGHIGEIALSGAALGSTYFLTVFMVAVGFSLGAQIIMARRNGEQNYEKIGPVFYQAVFCLLAFSFVIIALSHFGTPVLLGCIISSPDVYQASLDYIIWRFWGFIPVFIVIIMRSFYIAITQTKVLKFAAILTVISNVLLNYTLIFGKFGFPQMGIAGAALASVLAETISLIFMICYTLAEIDLRKYALTRLVYKNWKLLKEILNLSVWTMLQQFLSIGSWFIFFLAIEHLGATSLASANIIRSISAFPFIIINSLAITAGTLVSNLIGAGEDNRVLSCCNKLILLAAAITLPLLFFLAAVRTPLLGVYTNDSGLIAYSLTVYLVMLAGFLPYIPGLILFNAISGTGQTKVAMKIELWTTVAYIIHVALVIFYLQADIAWCWTADCLYNGMIFVLSAWYMYQNKWCCKIV